MMRNIFDVSADEKRRILGLHESATKNQYLIYEQQPSTETPEVTTITTIAPVTTVKPTPEVTKTTKFGPIPLGDRFEYGKYESNTVKNNILELKPKIESFISTNTDYSSFEASITAGESKVTNPAGFETPGSLALARANSVKKYFEEIFPDLIKNGKLIIKSPSSVSDVVIGDTPYKAGQQNDVKLKPLYQREQFVNFEIKGIGAVTTKGTTTETDSGDTLNKRCGESVNASELKGFGDINKDFSLDAKINMTTETGTLTITVDCLTMPDILFFEVEGKTDIPGNFMKFRGENSEWTRLFLGTALMAKYGVSLPESLSKNGYSLMVPTGDTITRNLGEMDGWGLNTFNNVFGAETSPVKNESWMDILNGYKTHKSPKKLIRTLGPKFPWGYLNGDILPSVGKIGPISVSNNKKATLVKLTNMAPNENTKWRFDISCK